MTLITATGVAVARRGDREAAARAWRDAKFAGRITRSERSR